MSEDDFLDPASATHYLSQFGMRHTVATLAKLRTTGGGPVYLRIGRNIRYTPGHLREYADRRTTLMASTSAPVAVDQVTP